MYLDKNKEYATKQKDLHIFHSIENLLVTSMMVVFKFRIAFVLFIIDFFFFSPISLSSYLYKFHNNTLCNNLLSKLEISVLNKSHSNFGLDSENRNNIYYK